MARTGPTDKQYRPTGAAFKSVTSRKSRRCSSILDSGFWGRWLRLAV